MPPSPTQIMNDHNKTSPLPRSASYTHLPTAPAIEVSPPTLRRTFSDLSFPGHSESPSKESVAAGKDILRRTSVRSKEKPAIGSKEKPTIGVSRFSVSTEELSNDGTVEPRDNAITVPETKPPEPAVRPAKGRSMSGRLASLARKPWSNSRSRSPSFGVDEKTRPRSQARPGKTTPLQTDAATTENVADVAVESKRRTVLHKRPRRPTVAVVATGGDPSTPTSPSPSLRSKSSFAKFTSSPNVSTPVLPAMPKNAAATAAILSPGSPEPPRKRDDLWGVFRGLDADYQKFQSKSSALKANVIRSSLLPFLSRHRQVPCGNLRPEDLDRRVNILNKWWTGLLEMLNGKNNQSISGTDRPVYLEAVVGIMTRPEWRVPFPMSQSNGSTPNLLQQPATSISESSDASSSGSEFLIASIHHNVRNIFMQNLLSQMAFVVGRLSMRHAPASLVAFCGKACAYAFFFCPGVADILIRLWNTPPDIFRRVLEESGIYRNTNMRSFSQDLALNFPVTLRSLSFQSYASFVRYLRQSPDAPLSTTQIPWQGPWISRWCGRDTDLFFVFVKYVHILYADCFPSGMDKSKRILAPGLLSIHGQLLVVLEDTLYKQSMPQVADNFHTAAAVTFDDFIEGTDASVSALPLGATNGNRSMAENRLIILLRDFLSESSLEPDCARLLYAESFCGIMKAAARKTSLFDHNACFLLCDFIEETIPIIMRYSQSIEVELFDWSFWLEVCRHMTHSQNSMTEIRVFSFLFCIWNTWVATEDRKSDLCLGFLLHETLFYRYFSHWSPMVRAYFHRLLCWRVARFNGEPTPLDSTIYDTLSNRLQQTFAYYVAFQSKAEEELTAPLSSAPCTPAPGRRIIIIRCDNQPSPPASLFVSFDRVVPPASSEQTLMWKNHHSLKTDSPASESQPVQKKRWSIFKAVFGVSNNSKSGERTASNSLEESETNGTTASDMSSDDQGRAHHGSSEQLRLKTPHQPFCFKFSLEWTDRPQWPSKNKRLFSPCLPVATQLHVQHRRSRVESDGYETASEYASDEDSQEAAKSYDDDDGREKPAIDGTAVQLENTLPNEVSEKVMETRDPKPMMTFSKFAVSKYAGRALAEWAQIVSECDSFFARRRDEGVPSDRMVETPTLGVESFRK